MQIFAHRGFSAQYPENSQSAISAVKNTQATGVEFDIFQVGKEFVVSHDRSLNRLFGIDKRLIDLSSSELAKLKNKDDQPLATLEWVLANLSDSHLQLNIEIKHVDSIEYFYQTLLQFSLDQGLKFERLLISSFNHTYLEYISQQSENIRLGVLMATHPIELKPTLPDFEFYSLHLDMDCISAQLIQQAKALNYQVYVFTVDNENEIHWLINNKVDAIFANHPVQAHKIINNFD